MEKVMRMSTIVAACAALLFGPLTLAQSDRSEKARVAALAPDDAREDAAAKAQPVAALEPCDADCVQRRREEKLRERVEDEMARVPSGACTATYYDLNATSKRLAEEAVEECRLNYVMKKLDPKYVARTEARERSVAYNRELTKRGEQAVKALSLLWLARQQQP